MIKILHIARPVAGLGVYISLLTKYINKNKFSNAIICNTNDEIIELLDTNNHKISTYHANLIRKINLINDVKTFFKIVKILKKERPDIIHCHSAKAGILGRLAGAYLKITTFYTPHAYSYLSAEGKFKKYFFKKLEKLLGFLPSKTIACSESEYIRATTDINIAKDKVLLWCNSVEDVFVSEKAAISEVLPKEYICTIGRVSYQKNIQLLIESIKIVKKKNAAIHLVILGAGLYSPMLNQVNQLINKHSLKDNITIIPWLKRTKTLAILQQSKFYVSSSRYEGLPYSLLEALALKKPCVVTNVDGNKDVIKDNFNGFVTLENPEDIALKINMLIENNELLQQFSINARKEYETRYDIDKNIILLENLYNH
ncbi:O-antigen biosynthesis glycosyltransferase WbnH [Polaribacter huanghezhanensis]|uniref:glycosyltransferase n=1 Tax=Polaribacter huanghezhanensis TaxID=1354726 RepID=UPI00264A13ED|nr:glycosyltransferase [Polaribacter huanghezhanensis]WKD85556.1 O-antigen biosynthesis glycosyltransferase WbnH [Polaribacter huanghezhanensis]